MTSAASSESANVVRTRSPGATACSAPVVASVDLGAHDHRDLPGQSGVARDGEADPVGVGIDASASNLGERPVALFCDQKLTGLTVLHDACTAPHGNLLAAICAAGVNYQRLITPGQ